jgi:hypothetical protein
MSTVSEDTRSRLNTTSLESRAAYSPYRIVAAFQLAMDLVRDNQEIIRNPPANAKLKPTDRAIDPIMSPIAPYLCYAVAPGSFLYGLFALRYSSQKQGHILK